MHIIQIFEFESYHIGDPSLIGLSCESGDFSDCQLDEEFEPVPIGCDGVLIFSDNSSTCGSSCESDRKRRSVSIKKSGWTKSFVSTDTSDGTGDHEHYYQYLGKSKSDRLVYDSNGVTYTNCDKKAIQIKQREIGRYWWKLVKEYTLEWMAIFETTSRTMHNSMALLHGSYGLFTYDSLIYNNYLPSSGFGFLEI